MSDWRGKEQGGNEDEPGHDVVEDALLGVEEDEAAYDATEQAAEKEGPEERAAGDDFLPIAPGSTERAGPQADGAGGVGGLAIEAHPDEQGKREQRAATSDRIHRPCYDGGDKGEEKVKGIGGHGCIV